ncbi:hypothetical protein ACSDR0_11505 [Streptosporangium sp. G11]|uniref:hypothetical protein n=1 Tax=Streptosporangium sp. G11 TaxID=3436926 RepID=UPI003EBE138B
MAEIATASTIRRVATWHTRASVALVVPSLLLMILVLAGCSASGVEGSYRPAFIPVKFTVNPSGDLQISGESSLVTPVGVFSIGAKYDLPSRDGDAIYVIIRDGNASHDRSIAGFDHIYEIKSGAGEFKAVVNGTTSIQVVNREVLIDITQGTVQTIEFTGAEAVLRERPADIMTRWEDYWASSFYVPFALSRWAYDDSTMSKWFGIGFVWFLIRLLVALVLFVVDVFLTLGCVLAAVAFVIFGPTGQNIMYGLEVLFTLFVLAWGWAIAMDL